MRLRDCITYSYEDLLSLPCSMQTESISLLVAFQHFIKIWRSFGLSRLPYALPSKASHYAYRPNVLIQ